MQCQRRCLHVIRLNRCVASTSTVSQGQQVEQQTPRQQQQKQKYKRQQQQQASSTNKLSANPVARASATCLTRPELDFGYLLDPKNLDEITTNINARKRVGNIERVYELWNQIEAHISGQFSGAASSGNKNLAEQPPAASTSQSTADPPALNKNEKLSSTELERLWDEFYSEANLIPNKTHPATPIGTSEASTLIETVGEAKEQERHGDIPAETALGVAKLWANNLGHSAGERAYVLLDSLATLKHCLTRFALKTLIHEHSFTPITVPDILSSEVPLACGLVQRTPKNILYQINEDPKLEPKPKRSTKEPVPEPKMDTEGSLGQQARSRLCLSGTGEMGIANYLAGRCFFTSELPLKLVTRSRCFRPEVSESKVESGLYRLHEFDKVEMFVVTEDRAEASDAAFEELMMIQKELLTSLGLHFKVLEMSSEELGAPAYRKVDMEAWLPGRQIFGEVTSVSNCTDFQSRRLNIKHRPNKSAPPRFVHTLNGTALAIPRTIIALTEQHLMKSNAFVYGATSPPRFVHTLNGTALAIPETIIALTEQHLMKTNAVRIPKALLPFFHQQSLYPSRNRLATNVWSCSSAFTFKF